VEPTAVAPSIKVEPTAVAPIIKVEPIAAHSQRSARPSNAVQSTQTPPYKHDAKVIVPDGAVTAEDLQRGLDVIEFPKNEMRRNFTKTGEAYNGFTIGLVRNYATGLCLSAQWNAGTNLIRLITKHVKQTFPDFVFTTAVVNKNVDAALHTDSNNQGPSLIIELGSFQGGGLWVYDEYGEIQVSVPAGCRLHGSWAARAPVGTKLLGKVISSRGVWSRFEGTAPHQTFERITNGDRFSVILYSVRNANTIPEKLRCSLLEMGMNPPSPDRLIIDIPESEEEDAEFDGADDTDMPTPTSTPSVHSSFHAHTDTDIVEMIMQELKGTVKSFDFDGRIALLQGFCQMGKSREIAIGAWLSFFKHGALPIIFVKNHGGNEAAKQLRGNIESFNVTISDIVTKRLMGSQVDARRFQLVPKLSVQEYVQGSLDAQVFILLSNVPQVRQVKTKIAPRIERQASGRLRMVLIFDEDDLNTMSSDRTESALEQELFVSREGCGIDAGLEDQSESSSSTCFRDAVLQVISVTATIGAIVLNEQKPMQIRVMPLESHYWGLNPDVPSQRRPVFKEVCKEDMGDDDVACLPRGLSNMLEDMITSESDTMALIHVKTQIEEQKQLQKALVQKFSTQRLIVVTHNSGQNFHTLKARRADRGDSGVCGRSSGSEYTLETKFPLTALATEPLRIDFREYLEKIAQGSHRSVDDLQRFPREKRVMDVLSMLRDFRSDQHMKGMGKIVIAIISGHAGGRGTTFRDDTHQCYVTDLFLSKTLDVTGEYLVQLANRISGIFRKPTGEPMVPHRLQLWTSRCIYDMLQAHMERLNKLSSILQETNGKPLRETMQQHPHLIKLPPLPTQHGSALKIARHKVEAGFIEKTHSRIDPGNLRTRFGAGDATDLMLEAPAAVDSQPLDIIAGIRDEQPLSSAVCKAYGCAGSVKTILLDSVLIIPYSDFSGEVQAWLQLESSGPSLTKKLNPHIKQRIGIAERPEGTDTFRTIETVNSEERLGRSASIMRENLKKNDYCDAVMQLDSENQSVIAIIRTYSWKSFLRLCDEEQSQPDEMRSIFVWRAFAEIGSSQLCVLVARYGTGSHVRVREAPPPKRPRLESLREDAEDPAASVQASSASNPASMAPTQHQSLQACKDLISTKRRTIFPSKLQALEQTLPSLNADLRQRVQDMLTRIGNRFDQRGPYKNMARELLRVLEDALTTVNP
jgi:hypothetical protein